MRTAPCRNRTLIGRTGAASMRSSTPCSRSTKKLSRREADGEQQEEDGHRRAVVADGLQFLGPECSDRPPVPATSGGRRRARPCSVGDWPAATAVATLSRSALTWATNDGRSRWRSGRQRVVDVGQGGEGQRADTADRCGEARWDDHCRSGAPGRGPWPPPSVAGLGHHGDQIPSPGLVERLHQPNGCRSMIGVDDPQREMDRLGPPEGQAHQRGDHQGCYDARGRGRSGPGSVGGGPFRQ